MDTNDDAAPDPRAGPEETYNPWSIVNLVFRHLADEGLHPVLGEAGDPGAPAAALLRAFGITPSADTLEEDVKAALTKVSLGEVDAALVYVTDVIAAGDDVEGIEVPEASKVVNSYPIGIVADSKQQYLAQKFIDFVTSSGGQDTLSLAGFYNLDL